MYNPQLKTFLDVADAGSFSKAATQQYITAPALIKQINLLEKNLGVTLFDRTHRGLELTAAGKVMYQEAKHIIRHCEEAACRIRQISIRNENTIRVGFSPLSPPNELVRLLPQLHQLCPGLEIHMVPFINNAATASDILRNLGQDIDVVMGIFDDTTLGLRQCAGTELRRIPLCCAVPLHHPLAQKEKLTFADLACQDLMLIQRGWSQTTDMLWNELSHHPKVHCISFDVFSLEQFNRCVNGNMIMVAVPIWSNVHPQLKYLEVDWDFSIPYGLFHAPEPTASVRQFIGAVQTIMT